VKLACIKVIAIFLETSTVTNIDHVLQLFFFYYGAIRVVFEYKLKPYLIFTIGLKLQSQCAQLIRFEN